MKCFITGAAGQLGYDLNRVLTTFGYEVMATDYDSVDITNNNQVLNSVKSFRPDIIFHCAAYTAVDHAEDEPQKCYDINVVGTKHLVEAAREVGSKIVYISTDYVFDGTKNGVYEVDDLANPTSVYGSTKFKGEELVRMYEKHFIVRISWVFGINGNNFVKTMIKLGKEKAELSIIDDQVGSPTYTYDLAYLLKELSLTTKYGTYHVTNEGYCSWADFAREIFKLCSLDVVVNNITTNQYPTKAKRPLNSRLSKRSLNENGFKNLQNWQEALKDYINELIEKEEI